MKVLLVLFDNPIHLMTCIYSQLIYYNCMKSFLDFPLHNLEELKRKSSNKFLKRNLKFLFSDYSEDHIYNK